MLDALKRIFIASERSMDPEHESHLQKLAAVLDADDRVPKPVDLLAQEDGDLEGERARGGSAPIAAVNMIVD